MFIKQFPRESETFVSRQARGLGATIVALTVNDLHGEAIRAVQIASTLPSETVRRIKRRLRSRFGGQFIDDWPADVERAWREFLITERPDAAIAQFGPNAIRCLAACRDLDIPLVAHFHGYDASGLLRSKDYRQRLGPVFEYATAVVVVAEYMRDALTRLGCPDSKIFTIPCGVPVKDFAVARNVSRQPCRFLMVGRLVPKKNPMATLKAFALCWEQVPDVAITVIGEGPLFYKMARWLRHKPFAPRVSLLGALPFNIVEQHFLKSSVFVQHSVTASNGDMEGWPVAIAEAGAYGLPVVATRHAGIPDQIQDGVNGMLVEEHDIEGMANRMVTLAQDPDLRLRMGQSGRRKMLHEGNSETQIEKLRQLLPGSSPPRQVDSSNVESSDID